VSDRLDIRPAEPADADGIWAIIEPVVRPGDTYAIPPDIDRDRALALWLAPAINTFVAESPSGIVGTYTLKPNHPGPGDHVANCAYMVHPVAQGQGVGRALAEHSLTLARGRGFRSMQYNLVVSTNHSAIRLWQKLGFRIAGTLPGAFRHPVAGEVDAYVMYRWL